MLVVPVPCLTDNYAYLLVCSRTALAAVVDPSEPAPVITAVSRWGVTLAAILCTHHHGDHVGGVSDLVAHYGQRIAVYGHSSERARIPRLSHPVEHGDSWRLGDVHLRALHVPGHTTGAVAFVANATTVFTGDTLFVAGCGRLFEGTPEAMYKSLHNVLNTLPPETAIYPGHEYAEKNLRFATMVEPNNPAVQSRHAQVRTRRAAGELCIPSTLADERATNPFLRLNSEAVRAFARARSVLDEHDPIAVFTALRKARDAF